MRNCAIFAVACLFSGTVAAENLPSLAFQDGAQMAQTETEIMGSGRTDRCSTNYSPIEVASPVYPKRAASRGIEGYAIVRFTLASDGSKENIQVVESNPQRVFDRAAIQAVEETRYEPCHENGTPMAIAGLSLKFKFQVN